MGVEGRARWLGKWRDWLLDHTDDLLTLLQLETGKSWGDTNVEIAAVQIINYWIDNAADFLADETVRPYGAANAAKKLTISLRALSARRGDHTVERPTFGATARHSRRVDGRVRRAVQAVGGHPAGVADRGRRVESRSAHRTCSTRCTGSAQTGAALVDLVDYVMFTGSVNTGRRIAVAAAQRLIPCSLELGGKDAMIVCADADIDRAADGAVWGAFAYTGQVCISVERVYVEEPVYDEFVSKLVAKTSQLRQGMDAEHDFSCDVGSMTTAQQLAIVSDHVDDAVSKGARVLVGGKSGDSTPGCSTSQQCWSTSTTT